MKQVLKISVSGNFQQFLLKTEVRFVIQICKDFGTAVTVELVDLSISEYNFYFGKQKIKDNETI